VAEIRIRNLPDWVVNCYKQTATENGKTLEGYMRQMLEGSLLSEQAAIADTLQQGLLELADKYGPMPDSTNLLREVRDESE
jgi:plasmid stability protein